MTYLNTSKAQPIGQKSQMKKDTFVFDTHSQSYLAVKYEADTRQWYFICQDIQTRNWIATQPIPSTFNLGRQSIRTSTIQAAEVDDTYKGQSNRPSDHRHNSMATTTQTQTQASTSTGAAALTLAGTSAPTLSRLTSKT